MVILYEFIYIFYENNKPQQEIDVGHDLIGKKMIRSVVFVGQHATTKTEQIEK